MSENPVWCPYCDKIQKLSPYMEHSGKLYDKDVFEHVCESCGKKFRYRVKTEVEFFYISEEISEEVQR